MSTLKQQQAARANGAKSKGPTTPQGKRNSSRNSTRHGLFAKSIVLRDEYEDVFLELVTELFEEHQPATPTQRMLVETIAAARWRQTRIWEMQKEAFDQDVHTCDAETEVPALRAVLALRGSPETVRSHELLLRYEIALDRQISRALLRLQQLQEKTAPAERPHQPLQNKPAPSPAVPDPKPQTKNPLNPNSPNPKPTKPELPPTSPVPKRGGTPGSATPGREGSPTPESKASAQPPPVPTRD